MAGRFVTSRSVMVVAFIVGMFGVVEDASAQGLFDLFRPPRPQQQQRQQQQRPQQQQFQPRQFQQQRRTTNVQTPFGGVYNGPGGTFVRTPFINVSVPRQNFVQQPQYRAYRLPDGRQVLMPVQQPQYFNPQQQFGQVPGTVGPNGVVPQSGLTQNRVQQNGPVAPGVPGTRPGFNPANGTANQAVANQGQGPLLLPPPGAINDSQNVASTTTPGDEPPLMPIPDSGPEPTLPKTPASEAGGPLLSGTQSPTGPSLSGVRESAKPAVVTSPQPTTVPRTTAGTDKLRIELSSAIEIVANTNESGDDGFETVRSSSKDGPAIQQVSGESPLLLPPSEDDPPRPPSVDEAESKTEKGIRSFLIPGQQSSLPSMKVLRSDAKPSGTGTRVVELTPVKHTELKEYYQPSAGIHVFAVRHPFTGTAYAIQLQLPDGQPKISSTADKVTFDFGTLRRAIVFSRDGKLRLANQ